MSPLGRGKRRAKIEGQFAPRLVEMLRSPAWSVTSLSARRVIDRLEIELADHGGNDNGKLPCTYADFVAYGIDRHAIAPAIREAVALGFLEVTEQGRAGNAEFRTPSRYRLTFRDTQYAGPTNEWRRIKTEPEAEAIARDARRMPETSRRNQKQKTSGGKHHFSVGEPHTENAKSPVGKTPTTVPVGETHTTLDISGRGCSNRMEPEPDIPAFLDRRTWKGGGSEPGEASALKAQASGARR